MMDAREVLIGLNLVPRIGSAQLARLLKVFGGIEDMARATVQKLQRAGGPKAGEIAAAMRNQQVVAAELTLAQRAGVRLVTLADSEYPAALKSIPDPPLVIYMKGALTDEDRLALAVVGARQASCYGLQTAERLGHDFALRGLTVVSGLARGIDAAAHRGALKAGRTVAVLGGGLLNVYPPEHKRLAAQIAEHGALLSEYPMAAGPLPYHFPRRNRLISGLSCGVVVVEAGLRSGALITADCGLEQGREVFAVPGPVSARTSQGTNQLLRQGAALITCAEEALEALPQLRRPVQRAAAFSEPAQPVLSKAQQGVLACLSADEPYGIDRLVIASGMGLAELASSLLQLELKRCIVQLPGKRFIRQRPRSG